MENTKLSTESDIEMEMEIEKMIREMEMKDYGDGENEDYDEDYENFIKKKNPTVNECLDELKKIEKWNLKNVSYENMRKNKINKLVGYVLLELNIKKVDKAWSKSQYYINKELENIFQKGKYVNSRRDFMKGKILEAPIIEYKNGIIEVINGRNRMANMRDLGYEIVPVFCEEGKLNEILNAFC